MEVKDRVRDILCYTRKPIDEFYYDPKLAYSMHLALGEEGGFQALNHNSGVLFAKATENEDGSLNAKSIRNPYLFVMKDGTYGVVAVRVDGDGGEDVESTGKAIFCTSHDLLEYKEEGLLSLCEGAVDRVVCRYDPGKEMYELCWCQSDQQWHKTELQDIECTDQKITGVKVDELVLPVVETEIEGAVAGNVISIPDETAKRLQQKLQPPSHIKTEVPEEVQAASREQLDMVWARALYSDGAVREFTRQRGSFIRIIFLSLWRRTGQIPALHTGTENIILLLPMTQTRTILYMSEKRIPFRAWWRQKSI